VIQQEDYDEIRGVVTNRVIVISIISETCTPITIPVDHNKRNIDLNVSGKLKPSTSFQTYHNYVTYKINCLIDIQLDGFQYFQ